MPEIFTIFLKFCVEFERKKYFFVIRPEFRCSGTKFSHFSLFRHCRTQFSRFDRDFRETYAKTKWRPKITLEEGLKRTLNWYENDFELLEKASNGRSI